MTDTDVRTKILTLQNDFDPYPLDWQYERRKVYLKTLLEELVFDLLVALDSHAAAIAKADVVGMIFLKERIDGLWSKVQDIQGELIRWRKRLAGKHERITPEMIEQARLYPFTQLYQFNRNTALCPFHEDHDPSFVLMKDNRARCFGACSTSWDTIAFIRQREGLSFPEAVRRLQ